MCRYMVTWYPSSYACIPCRHVAQYHPDIDGAPRCPNCRADLTLMGRDFKAPRKRDDAGWRAVSAVIASGKVYDSCGCNGPGPRPSTIADVRMASFERPWHSRGRK